MPKPDLERLERVLGGPELANLRRRLRRRYQAQVIPADGFTLGNLAPAEAAALAGLLGRRQRHCASMRLSHRELDAALAGAGIAPGLRAALALLDGPITDTQDARERRRRAWAETLAEARDPRLIEALADPHVQGLLKRLAAGDSAAAAQLIARSERVLADLPKSGIALARLAAGVLGDAHALDRGHPVATIVLRALAASDATQRPRELWAGQGVLVNELAKPVVILNLVAGGTGFVARLVQTAARFGEPLHLSLRQLSREPPVWQPDQCIHVCENPEVLAAAADALGRDCPAMVSLDGQLSAAPRTLLDELAAAGARFLYHGDFDWGGVTIANHFLARYPGAPWRFGADDYQPDTGPRLKGGPVTASWDAQLAARMQDAGIAVHEESLLGPLLGDLAEQTEPRRRSAV